MISKAYLIGVVRAYVPYRDVAISEQTKRPRIVFEENSGLAEVHPVDCINKLIEDHLKKSAPVDASEETVEEPVSQSEQP